MDTQTQVALLAIACALVAGAVGYFVNRLHGDVNRVDCDVKQLERDVDADRKEVALTRHQLRNEINAAVGGEEVRRKEADFAMEARTNASVQNLVSEMRLNHADTKSDMRTLTDLVKTVVARTTTRRE